MLCIRGNNVMPVNGVYIKAAGCSSELHEVPKKKFLVCNMGCLQNCGKY